MSLFGVRSLADVRALLYTLLPVLSALLVTQGVLNENQASLWGGLVTALLGPGIAFVTARSVSTFRPAFYAMLAAGQALLVGYGLATIGPGIGVAMVFAAVINGTARQPEARGALLSTAWIGFAVVEALAIIGIALAFAIQ